MKTSIVSGALALNLACFALACSSDDTDASLPPSATTGGASSGGAVGSGGAKTGGALGTGGAATGGASAFNQQIPPSTKAEMAAWLSEYKAKDWEKQWVCEATATAKTAGASAIHVHGASNRVCNNQALSKATLTKPAELPVGVAAIKHVDAGTYVEVKTAATSNGGDNWFWYSPDGSVASKGAMECKGCHSAAGSDADHPGLGDYVYFQVKN